MAENKTFQIIHETECLVDDNKFILFPNKSSNSTLKHTNFFTRFLVFDKTFSTHLSTNWYSNVKQVLRYSVQIRRNRKIVNRRRIQITQIFLCSNELRGTENSFTSLLMH